MWGIWECSVVRDGCRRGKWGFSGPFGVENSVGWLCLEELGVIGASNGSFKPLSLPAYRTRVMGTVSSV